MKYGWIFGVFWAGCTLMAEPFGRQESAAGISHSFLVTGPRTVWVGEDCEIVWSVPEKSRDGMVLENGHILVSHYKEVREYTRDGEVVWKYALAKENQEMGSAVRLADGNTLVVERGKKPRLLEVTSSGDIAREVPLLPETDNGHMQTRMARKLPNGNYIVPHLLAFKVKEYQPDGTVVREIETDREELGGRAAENWPFTAILLENGNFLVNLTHGNKTVEFTPDGDIAWKLENGDVDGRFADPCGGQRLPNGHVVICPYGQRNTQKPKLFEVNAQKQVVWQYFNPQLPGAHEVHVLTTNGEAIRDIRR